MYFSDITNSELIKYHQQVKNNFELPFSEMITSAMFKVETIISNKLYKVYPLFYCENIKSTNPNDEIMENKCIICQYNTDTLFTFQTNIILSNTIEGRWSISLIEFGIVIYVYDGITGKTFEDAKIEGGVTLQINNNDVVVNFEGITNVNGIFYQTFEGDRVRYINNLKITLSDGTVIDDYERGV